MKLSTTTLGCPEYDLPTAVRKIGGWGYDGIDFRGCAGEMQIWKLPEFSTALAASARLITDAGLETSCVSSGIRLTDTDPAVKASFDEELKRSAEVCAGLGCGQIRVFGGDLKLANGAIEADRPQVLAQVVDRASALAEMATAIAPVHLLIETHDAWTSSAHMAEILSRIDRDDVGCCWDVKHTWWVAKEDPAETWGRLARWVRNTHWKDVRKVDPACIADEDTANRVRGAGLLVPIGAGEAPLAECLAKMTAAGYPDWYTLEWERKWHPHIEPAEVVFPGFVAWMRDHADEV